MKKIISLLITFLLLLSSCFHEANNGYPKCVELPSDGGTKKIFGADSFSYIIIRDGSDEYAPKIDNAPTMTVSYDWLQVEYIRSNTYFTITAEPNRTGHKRKLKVEGYFGYEYAVIEVIQGC